MRGAWGAWAAVWLVACAGASSPPELGDAGQEDSGRECAAFASYPCACDGYQGSYVCTSQGRRGACDCSRPSDGGATPSCDTPSSWFLDADGDGHGAGSAVVACEAPAGHVPSSDDCDDTDKRAHPGQTESFETPRTGGGFDFDCDGRSVPLLTELQGARCNYVGSTCIGAMTGGYWASTTIPECGASGQWIAMCSGLCGPQIESRRQKCR